MLCRKCKSKLKNLPQGFDALQMFGRIDQMYCENEGCKMMGIVVVAGILEQGEDTTEVKEGFEAFKEQLEDFKKRTK